MRQNIKYEEPFLHKVCSILLTKKGGDKVKTEEEKWYKEWNCTWKTRNFGVQALTPSARKKWLKYEQKKKWKKHLGTVESQLELHLWDWKWGAKGSPLQRSGLMAVMMMTVMLWCLWCWSLTLKKIFSSLKVAKTNVWIFRGSRKAWIFRSLSTRSSKHRWKSSTIFSPGWYSGDYHRH